MRFQSKLISTCLAVLVMSILPSLTFGQGYKTLIGWTDLFAEKGEALEDGTGVVVVQPEAPGSNADGEDIYMPNRQDGQFGGKNFTNGTGGSDDANSHATGVGRKFYGTSGIAGGISDITGYDANDYIGRILGFSSEGDPLAEGFDVGNHSYIGNGASEADTIDICQRFDFIINRDDTVMVVGANNGSGNSTPDLLAPSYNAITVGLTSGNHSRGPTSKYGPGRIKPDIVAPEGSTSGATPIVGAAAAILKEAGAGTNAARNEVIRSTLFAGATKDEFRSVWDRTAERPIDDVFGVGELNIYNSYHIFEGGEFDGSTSEPTSDVGAMGWDYGNFNGTDALYYNFEVTDEQTELSAALVWNIDVIDTDDSSEVFDATTSLANLDLELYDSTGSFMGTLLDSSVSTLYNLEHIYDYELAAGNYTFRISGDSAVDFGFSWRLNAVPEPTSAVLLGLGLLGLVARRRRLI